jgi:hypothetical protein
MQVFVRGTDGRHVAIEVQPDETIANLKNKIATQLGIRADEQILTYAGKPLVNGTLLDYSVQKDCTISLAVGVRGG